MTKPFKKNNNIFETYQNHCKWSNLETESMYRNTPKPNSNFTSNTHYFKNHLKTYFNYFLYSEYQLNLVNLIESYAKIAVLAID